MTLGNTLKKQNVRKRKNSKTYRNLLDVFSLGDLEAERPLE